MNSQNPKYPICLFNQKGLTLLENMIALLLLTVALLGAAAMQANSIKMNANARRDFRHSMAATEILETILSLPFDDPLLVDPDDGYSPAAADHGPFRIASSRATIEWEVDDGFPVPGAKRVGITIRTFGEAGRRKIFTYDYMKTRRFE
jgi:prepilin-type N-terminal cleavage/methylation domain-containing protein